MGISVLGLANITYRKHMRSMMDLNANKKKPRNYVDASNIPIVLALFAISEAAKADISLSGTAEVTVSTTSEITETDLTVTGSSGSTTVVESAAPESENITANNDTVNIDVDPSSNFYIQLGPPLPPMAVRT